MFHLELCIRHISIPKSFFKMGHLITRHVTITRKYLKSIADRIEHGANIDDQDYLSENVQLHYAVSYGHKRILKLLIENGVSID